MYGILRHYCHPTNEQIAREIKEKFGIKVVPSMISRWVRDEEKYRSRFSDRWKMKPTQLRQLDRLKREYGIKRRVHSEVYANLKEYYRSHPDKKPSEACCALGLDPKKWGRSATQAKFEIHQQLKSSEYNYSVNNY